MMNASLQHIFILDGGGMEGHHRQGTFFQKWKLPQHVRKDKHPKYVRTIIYTLPCKITAFLAIVVVSLYVALFEK